MDFIGLSMTKQDCIRLNRNLQDYLGLYWVISTRTGKKLDKCRFLIESLRLLRTEKSKNSFTFMSYYLILAVTVSKIRVSGFKRNLGCALYAQSWVFFQNFRSTAFFVDLSLGY